MQVLERASVVCMCNANAAETGVVLCELEGKSTPKEGSQGCPRMALMVEADICVPQLLPSIVDCKTMVTHGEVASTPCAQWRSLWPLNQHPVAAFNAGMVKVDARLALIGAAASCDAMRKWKQGSSDPLQSHHR